MKRLLWKAGLTLLGLALVAASMVLHVRSQERYDMVWLAAGSQAWDFTTQNGCLSTHLSGVELDRWFGHDSQIIGEMPRAKAWSVDFSKGASGIKVAISVPLWLVASLGLVIALLPWVPHRG